MAKYRQVCPKIWNDAKFKSLSDDAKLLFFLLLTHPHTSAIGTLRAYIQALAPELGWKFERLSKAFQEAFQKTLCKADLKAGLIWLPNFLKYNKPQSPNVVKSWIGAFDDCPECNLKNEVFQQLERYTESLTKDFKKAFQEAFQKTMPNQEQEQEQEQDIINAPTEVVAAQKMPDEKYISFTRRFQNEVCINLGNTAPKVTEALIRNGALELEKAIRIDCFDWHELQDALIWATTDDFWRQNLRSLAGMRKTTKSGSTKIQMVVSKYREHKRESEKPRYNRNPCN